MAEFGEGGDAAVGDRLVVGEVAVVGAPAAEEEFAAELAAGEWVFREADEGGAAEAIDDVAVFGVFGAAEGVVRFEADDAVGCVGEEAVG